VLSKPTVAERKFGLMSGCDHPFCVGCIRGWRSGSHAPGMDIDTVVRACPVCRVASHFIVPSVVWYSSSEEKEDIINGCKNKLRCVHENLKLFVLFDVPIMT
jgi:E3 ubiquitin-protein ligase makorin